MVGVSFHFTKWSPLFLKIVAVLYVGQHPGSRGITEIRTSRYQGEKN